MIKWILLCILLAGCNSDDPDLYFNPVKERGNSEIMVVGDSLCGGWPKIADISSDCLFGRAATAYNVMPSDREVILYGLITNDVLYSREEDYRPQIQYHFSQVDSRIICLIPSPDFGNDKKNQKFERLKQVMLEECPETIDMKASGYLHSHPDGIHGLEQDKQDFGNYIKGLIESDIL